MATIMLLALTKDLQPSFSVSLAAKRIVNALVAHRARAAAAELRRHSALLNDLGAGKVGLTRADVAPFAV
jgi:hypothetical protein